LQKFPLADDQIIVAGVIDDLTAALSSTPEVVADRLGKRRRASSATQGGCMRGSRLRLLDTSAGMGRVTEDVVWGQDEGDGAKAAKIAQPAAGPRINPFRIAGAVGKTDDWLEPGAVRPSADARSRAPQDEDFCVCHQKISLMLRSAREGASRSTHGAERPAVDTASPTASFAFGSAGSFRPGIWRACDESAYGSAGPTA